MKIAPAFRRYDVRSNTTQADTFDMAQEASGNPATGHDNQATGSGAAQNIDKNGSRFTS